MYIYTCLHMHVYMHTFVCISCVHTRLCVPSTSIQRLVWPESSSVGWELCLERRWLPQVGSLAPPHGGLPVNTARLLERQPLLWLELGKTSVVGDWAPWLQPQVRALDGRWSRLSG